MGKPFKNLTSPKTNATKSAPEPLLPKEPVLGNLSVNEEPLNASVARDHSEVLARDPVDLGTKPMKLKGG